MGQPSHPNGSRVNSIQTADNSLSWHTKEGAFFFQSYLLSILFKFIRHWLTASLVIPYANPWYDAGTSRLAKLKSRRAKPLKKGVMPDLDWHNNLPRALSDLGKGKATPKPLSVITFRYFRKIPSSLFLRDSLGDLLRPSVIMKRQRRSFTY